MSQEARSAVMAKIRGKDTGPERSLAAALLKRGLCWESHSVDLPGRPDFVFRQSHVAVFVDGDFWHGFRFHLWRDKLSEVWEAKIEANRSRDRRNRAALREAGWTVVRVWEHEIKRSAVRASRKVARAIEVASAAEVSWPPDVESSSPTS
ncbi:MAG: very short patch repair endonuclease [Caulobacteraceae bacterium]